MSNSNLRNIIDLTSVLSDDDSYDEDEVVIDPSKGATSRLNATIKNIECVSEFYDDDSDVSVSLEELGDLDWVKNMDSMMSFQSKCENISLLSRSTFQTNPFDDPSKTDKLESVLLPPPSSPSTFQTSSFDKLSKIDKMESLLLPTSSRESTLQRSSFDNYSKADTLESLLLSAPSPPNFLPSGTFRNKQYTKVLKQEVVESKYHNIQWDRYCLFENIGRIIPMKKLKHLT